MTDRLAMTCAVAALLAAPVLAAVPAWADATGDEITVNSVGDGDNSGAPNEGNAVDNDFVSFYSMGEGGEVVIFFTDNTALPDGTPAADITIWERCGNSTIGVANADEPVDVDLSQGAGFVNDVVTGTTSDGASAVLEGSAFICPVQVDLDSVALAGATQVRITDLCDPDGADSNGCDNTNFGGFDPAEVEALNSLAFGTGQIMKMIVGDSDITETGSNSGFDGEQTFQFEIQVTNPDGADLTGFTFQDTVPAEFDVTAAVADNTDSPTNLGCTVVGVSEGNGPFLAPDFVTFTVDLAAGESCKVTVDVRTDDDHPGRGRNPDFTPTTCPEGETLTLNDGVEVFDTASGDLIFRDDSSLELTCTFDPPA